MGDGADIALDAAMDDFELLERYRYADSATQYELGLIDEHGIEQFGADFKPNTLSKENAELIRKAKKWKPIRSKRHCPSCGSELVKKEGKFGTFMGCSTFPECKGSRSI